MGSREDKKETKKRPAKSRGGKRQTSSDANWLRSRSPEHRAGSGRAPEATTHIPWFF